MQSWPTWRFLVPFAVIYLCVAVFVLGRGGPDQVAAMYFFQLAAPWLAFGACVRRLSISAPRMRLSWGLLSLALLLWCIGMSLAAWDDLAHVNPTTTVAGYSDLAYYLYGFPILLAIASPTREELRSLFIWLEITQVIVTAILVFVTFFQVLPFMHQQYDPIPIAAMIRAYDVENIFLASGATIRFLSLAERTHRRHFFMLLASFLWTYALFAGIYNHLFVALQNNMGAYNALSSVPFLVLLIFAFITNREYVDSVPVDLLDRPVALFIENSSPIFYTVALFLLAIMQIRRHFYLGVSTLALALVIYAIRAIMLQSRFMRSERSLREARNWLEAMSLQDSLTGIANRRHFDNTLQSEWARGVRTRLPLSLLMMDIDHFKALNDTCGHLAGDRCLVEIAAALRELVPRKGDLLARYGGEEFAVILTATDSEGAQLLAERIRSAITEINVADLNATPRTITLSIGVATVTWPSELTPQDLIDEADRALYQAKRSGRNRVQVFA